MSTNIKTIVYFGDFDPAYSRNRVLIKGLRENGVEVLLCHENQLKGRKKYFSLVKKMKALPKDFDLVIIGYSDSRSMVPLAKLLFKQPIIWDAFYSVYDTLVFDKQIVKAGSLKAKWLWFLDWLSCFLSDKILLDTDSHINYFIKTFKAQNLGKFIKVLIGADDSVFKK
jgi:hypothetical protein